MPFVFAVSWLHLAREKWKALLCLYRWGDIPSFTRAEVIGLWSDLTGTITNISFRHKIEKNKNDLFHRWILIFRKFRIVVELIKRAQQQNKDPAAIVPLCWTTVWKCDGAAATSWHFMGKKSLTENLSFFRTLKCDECAADSATLSFPLLMPCFWAPCHKSWAPMFCFSGLHWSSPGAPAELPQPWVASQSSWEKEREQVCCTNGLTLLCQGIHLYPSLTGRNPTLHQLCNLHKWNKCCNNGFLQWIHSCVSAKFGKIIFK